MELVDLTVKEFVQILGSNEPAPGGGSAAALSATMGISLTKMVCELTLGKKKYVEYEDDIKLVFDETVSLQKKLLIAIDEDTEAFNAVAAVFSMPKETDTEKKARRVAMQTALQGAAESPFNMMKLMVIGLEVTKRAIGKSNTNAASDLGVAALNLKAGLQGAWLNVLINLSSIKDEEFVTQHRFEGEKLLAKGRLLADEIYMEILKVV